MSIMKTLAQHLETLNKIVSQNKLVADREAKLENLGYEIDYVRNYGAVGDYKVYYNREIRFIYASGDNHVRQCVVIPMDKIKPLSDRQVKKIVSLAKEDNIYQPASMKLYGKKYSRIVWDFDKVGILSHCQEKALTKAFCFSGSESQKAKHLKYFTPLIKKF